MKYFAFLAVSLMVSNCAMKQFNYTYRLTKPIQSDSLVYEDSILRMKFLMNEKAIGFRVDNKTDQAIKIPWDDIALAFNGYSKRVVHKETGTYKVHDNQPPTSVAPKSYLVDMLVPTENVSVYANKVTLAPIFPTYGISKSEKKRNFAKKGTVVQSISHSLRKADLCLILFILK